jgi:hypothetical protein
LRSFTSLPARLVLGLCLGWAALALARETGDAWEGWSQRQRNNLPCGWRFGMAPVERLRRCLGGIDGLVPSGSVVAFASLPGGCSAEFFRWRWAAYLLPGLEVVSLDDPAARQLAAYLITYRRLPEPPPGTRLELLRQLEGGRVYRILR